MSGTNFQASELRALFKQRRELYKLRLAFPEAGEMLALADKLSVERIRKIDDAEVLKEDFTEIEKALRGWASAVGSYDQALRSLHGDFVAADLDNSDRTSADGS